MDGKAIIVLGGVTSGVGKGVVAASVAHLMQISGHPVIVNKFDGLLNVSFEQMNPYQLTPDLIWTDEEITVLNDGSIVDSDLGVYERFTGLELTKDNNIINGDCWKELLDSQRNTNRRIGEVIAIHPHLTEIYKRRIRAAMRNDGISIFEIGGTVGDYESEHFLRTLANMKHEMEIMTLLVSYVPITVSIDTECTNTINQDIVLKPAKPSYHTALTLGLLPDTLLLRSKMPISVAARLRISSATGLSPDRILSDYNVSTIYHVPAVLREQGIVELICDHFSLSPKASTPRALENYASELDVLRENRKMRIALIGCTESWDSFITLQEAIEAASVQMKIRIDWFWVQKEEDYTELSKHHNEVAAFIITEGKENVHLKKRMLETALTENKPTLCISYGARLLAEMLGMQVMDINEAVTGSQTTILYQYGREEQYCERHRRNFRICSDPTPSSLGTALGCSLDKAEVHVFAANTAPNCTGVVFHPEYTSRPLCPSPWIMDKLHLAALSQGLNAYQAESTNEMKKGE